MVSLTLKLYESIIPLTAKTRKQHKERAVNLQLAYLKPDPALKLGRKMYGQCKLCGAWDYESQTAGKTDSNGKQIYKWVQRTVVETRIREGRPVRVPVSQQPKRIPVRVRMCQSCLEQGGYKKRPRMMTFGITRFETAKRCLEKFWKEPFLPPSDAMEQGSVDHAVIHWYTTKGNATFKRAVESYKPGISKSPLFHQQGPMGIAVQVMSENRFTKLRESDPENRLWTLLDHSLLNLKRLVKNGLVRLRSEWFSSRSHGLRLDDVESEFVVEATLAEIKRYYRYQPMTRLLADARFRGPVDFKLYFAGNRRKELVYIDWKGYQPTDAEVQELANSPQLRWYVLVDAMRHQISPKRLKSWTRMNLVFVTPDWHKVVPVPWHRDDPGELIEQMIQFVNRQVEALKAKEDDVPETERVTRFYPPTRSTLCETCPVRKHKLCSYWDPSAAKVPLEDLRHGYPISMEEVKLKI